MNKNCEGIKIEFCEDSMGEKIFFVCPEEENIVADSDETKLQMSENREINMSLKEEMTFDSTFYEYDKNDSFNPVDSDIKTSSDCKVLVDDKIDHRDDEEFERNQKKFSELLDDRSMHSVASQDEQEEKIRSFNCIYCSHKTPKISNLNRHIKTVHLKLKPLSCSQCDYKTSHGGHLKLHINSIHLKLKSYQCQECDYRASVKSTLTKHINAIHSKLKRFKCTICEYETSRSDSFKHHLNKIHLNLFIFNCSHCEYKTNKKSHFDRHMERIHLDQLSIV